MKRILVVEDSETNAAEISGLLTEMGTMPVVAKSSEEARRQLQHQQFDMIVLDIVLPEESGFELCRELRKLEEHRALPIVMCSNKASDMDKFWGMKQGATAYLTKPIDRSEFIRTLRALI